MKKTLAFVLCMSLAASQLTTAAGAENSRTPADLEPAVIKTLIEDNNFMVDDDRNGIITEEELAAARSVSVKLEGIDDISWMSRLEKCQYLTLYGGNITDFSVLEKMPALKNLFMHGVPVTDLSFLDNIDVEVCYLYDMEQITVEQRAEKCRIGDIVVTKGFEARLLDQPKGIFAGNDMRVEVEDQSIARLFSDNYKVMGYCGTVYGMAEGETTYHVYSGEKKVASGKITVKKADVFDPELHDTQPVDDFTTARINGKTGILYNGNIYTVDRNTVSLTLENVKKTASISTRWPDRMSYGSECILLNDGTLLIGGKPVPDMKFSDLYNQNLDGYASTEDGKLYRLLASRSKVTPELVAEDFREFTDNKGYYINTDGELIGYITETNDSLGIDVTLVPTGIMNPVHTDYLCAIDENSVLWHIYNSDSYSRKVTKIAENVVHSGDYYKPGTSLSKFAYKTADGVLHPFTGNDDIEGWLPERPEKFDIGYTDHGATPLYIYEGEKGISWKLDNDKTLNFIYGDLQYSVSNVKKATFSLVFDDERYYYIMRTDGSVWCCQVSNGEFTELLVPDGKVTEEPETPPDVPDEPEVPQEPEKTLSGDADGDGALTAKDLVLLRNYMFGADSSEVKSEIFDMNSDGIINIADLCILKSKITEV